MCLSNMWFVYSYSELKVANPKLYATIQIYISNAYLDYAFISDDEMAAIRDPQRMPQNLWALTAYPPIIYMSLPIVTTQHLIDEINRLMKFFMISHTRSKWFYISPFYQQIVELFMCFPQCEYQEALLHILINYITSVSNNYTSLRNLLKKYKSTNSTIHNLYDYVWHDKHILPKIAFNPDNSVSLLTLLCG